MAKAQHPVERATLVLGVVTAVILGILLWLYSPYVAVSLVLVIGIVIAAHRANAELKGILRTPIAQRNVTQRLEPRAHPTPAPSPAPAAGADRRPDPPERVREVIAALGTYEPLHAYAQELGYHAELAGWLRSKFPDLEVEIQRGRSRPDILIGDIAIEVKGPTDMRSLQTIADKCARYSQHFPHLIVVLFDLRVQRRMYDEWRDGILRTFPCVTIAEGGIGARRVQAEITCNACGALDNVPFEPRPGARLLCKACYRARPRPFPSSTGS